MKDPILIKWKTRVDYAKASSQLSVDEECICALATRVQELRKREKRQCKAYCKRLNFYVNQVNDTAEREMMALNKAEEYRTQVQPKLAELTESIARQDKAMENIRGYVESLLAWQRNVVQAWEWIGWTNNETITINKEWHNELGRTINSFLREVKHESCLPQSESWCSCAVPTSKLEITKE